MFCENLHVFTLGMQMIFANCFTKINATKVGFSKIQICFQYIDKTKFKSPIHNRVIFQRTKDIGSLLEAKHIRLTDDFHGKLAL